ncbi:MATE efflux family protein 5-like protein [Carex littledalei]|uniref:Protein DETOXIFICATION n=1 Tax=Carex littledalei TaxID=544730 RepID=A0A833QSP4_9POAL|nr:MATE efflux family protein 5-like protein [Carex littledalei]
MKTQTLETPLITESCDKDRRAEVKSEVKKQLWLAGPMIAGNLLQNVIQMISVMFVGHLGELSLSGASMASSFAGVTGYSLLMGSASAMDTLCGQAYGAKEYSLLGIYKQRAMLILTLLGIPLAAIWFYTNEILLICGQEADIAWEAGIYAKWMIPSLFAYGLLQCHVRFLQSQNIVFPVMLSSGLTALLHIFVCWLLVYGLGMGSKGAALGTGISNWINVAILAVYVRFSPNCKKTWVGFSKEAFHDLVEFIKLAVPSALMVCLGWWLFEFLVLLSGLLPNPQLETSVLSISLNTASFVYMIPFGLGGAISTRVSNELGAGRPETARLAVQVVLCLTITGGLIVGSILILIRDVWGYAYSNEEEVVKYVAIILPILAISNMLDSIQCVLSGVARGCGWQKIGAYVNLGAFYAVGIPSAILLGFVFNINGKGLWMGIICGIFVQAARKANERVYSSSLPTDMVAT